MGFREGQEKARKAELYMQKYCGCIFGEEDRYIRNRPLQKPPVQIFPKPVNPKKLARMQKAAANAAARASSMNGSRQAPPPENRSPRTHWRNCSGRFRM